MNIFDATVPQLVKTLRAVDNWLVAATTYAETKKFSVENLVHARLAPDAFSLVRQIQSVADSAKFVAGRLAGKEWPAHPDTETTFGQLRTRIATVITHLETYKAADFAGAEDRKISMSWMEGKWMSGTEYAIQFGMPNFFFHATTIYQILRHSGVDIGKRDFINGVPMHEG